MSFTIPTNWMGFKLFLDGAKKEIFIMNPFIKIFPKLNNHKLNIRFLL